MPWPQPRRDGAMPSLTRAHRALLAVLAAMAILCGLFPSVALDDHGLPVAATVTLRRPDDDEDDTDEDEEEDESDDEDSSDDDSDDSDDDDGEDGDDSDDDEVDEDELPDNVKAILKKERRARRDAERENRRLKRSAKPPAKPKAKPKPRDKDDEQDDQPSEREVQATQKLQRANLIAALSKGKHGLVDPSAAAKLAIQDGLADFDDDDEPTDIDDLVKDLVDEYAFLKGAKPKRKAPDIDSANGRSKKAPKLTADELKAAKAAGMTPEEYAAYQSPQPKLPAPKKKST